MLGFINKYIFGTAVPIMLVFAGIYYIFLLRGFHITKIGHIVRTMTKRHDKNGVSPFRALTLALAGTLGVGNIVGVSAAITLGGFGAVFWMWVSAFCAMLLKYAEIVLAMKYRVYDKEGKPHGSAMIYIKHYFFSIGLERFGNIIAVVFAAFFTLNSITMGSMIQVNAVTGSFESVFGISPMIVGALLSIAVAIIISNDAEGISRFTQALVPVMSIGYIILSVAVMILRAELLDDAFAQIFSSAFSSESAVGGILGFFVSRSLRYGAMRGLVSNEAGCGTAPTAHATSNSKSPVEQGFFGIFEVFVDTILLCTMTALVVIISYPSLGDFEFENNYIMMTLSAYSAVLGDFAKYFLVVAVLCFAFATIICWAHYGKESIGYLSKKRSVRYAFVIIYALSVFCGSFLASDIIWELADFAIGAMTLINVSVICLLSSEVKKDTELYFGGKATLSSATVRKRK